MLRVHGFYGHVKRNDLRSLAMFAGFLAAFQMVAAVALFLPLLVLDVGHAPLLSPSGYAARYVPVVFAAGVALFLVQYSRHVASVRSTVEFRYVDRRAEPRLVGAVEVQAIAAGLPCPRVGMIESPARNAFACGLSARSAVVVATRGLVEALDGRELAAVVAHEIAHIRNGDIRLMAAANALMDNLEWLRRKNPLRVRGWISIAVCVLMPAYLVLCCGAGLVNRIAFTLARVSRLLISSSREFVADAEAVRMTHDPAALVSALRRIEGRSALAGINPQADAMMIDGATEGAFASHPTIAERIAVLTRLSGAMAQAGPVPPPGPPPVDRAGPRRDGALGSEGPAARLSAPAPRRTLVDRVNAGAQEDLLGLTPARRKALFIGFGLLLALCVSSVVSFNAPTARRPEHGTRAITGLKDGTFSTARAPHPDTGLARAVALQRRAAKDPLGAGCFATEAYRVGDRGLHEAAPPDPGLVQAFSAGVVDGESEIKLERYLGHHLRSVRAVADAGSAELDDALAGHVRQRKLLLWVIHRFFGEPGLRAAREFSDNPDERRMLETLRRRLDERAPALVADPRFAAEVALLLSDPGDFVPCMARAS